MYKSRRSSLGYIVVVCILGIIGFGAYQFLSDLDGPTIVMSPDTGRVSPHQEITLTLEDQKSNVRSVNVLVRRSSGALTVFERTFTNASPKQTVTFSLKDAGLRDGKFELEITARDTAFAGFGRGNTNTITRDMRIDTQPPRVSVRSTTPSLRRGSITAIAYTLSEEVTKTGVQVGDIFFPAYLQPNGTYYCFIAFPLEIPMAQFTPTLIAKDLAGNEARTRVLVHAQERTYRNDTLNIDDRFLASKSADFESLLPEPLSDLERYVKINNVVRLKDEAVLRALASNTSPTMLWNGSFQRLPGSAVKANYGDKRTYMHNGQKIDNQTHMGLDLASVARAQIPAANNGRVIFAGPQGIFGNMVVVDHGLGLMTLYSHMSEILVHVGDMVNKGDIIAHTGTTGLAGGDHLHFGVLLGGVQLQPLDWLDKNWIKNTIIDRLETASK